ncbi:MAG: hypothetical protein ABIO72_02380 [Patescibacteria group bacterium]
MQNEHVQITPCASPDDAIRGRFLSDDRAAAGEARAYVARFSYRMLNRSKAPLDEVGVLFDLMSGGNYPESTPSAQVVSRPLPFSPHVGASGAVCLGESWRLSQGQQLLGELVVHVARLLNLDEPNPASLDGFDPDALSYWRTVLHGRPLNPGLRLPEVPVDLVYGLERQRVMRIATQARSGLRRVS